MGDFQTPTRGRFGFFGKITAFLYFLFVGGAGGGALEEQCQFKGNTI